jgi:PPM family protein phosphatase
MIEIVHHADPGPRPNMEDACAAAVLEVVAPIRHQFAIAALCDGVGGANAGEIASASASRLLVSALGTQLLLALGNAASALPPDVVLALLQHSLNRANDLVLAKSKEQPEWAGMATTALVTIIIDGLLYVGWVGDSRGHLLRNGKILRLTRDHSRVEELMADGQIAPAEAAHHPDAHTITQYLGKEEGFRPETQVLRLRPKDTIALNSDGLTDVLDDDQLALYLTEWDQEGCLFDAWAERLVHKALSAYTQDNTSVVLIRYQPDGPGDSVATATAHYSRPLSRILSPLTRS